MVCQAESTRRQRQDGNPRQKKLLASHERSAATTFKHSEIHKSLVYVPLPDNLLKYKCDDDETREGQNTTKDTVIDDAIIVNKRGDLDKVKNTSNFCQAMMDGTVFEDSASPIDFIKAIASCAIIDDLRGPSNAYHAADSIPSEPVNACTQFSRDLSANLEGFVSDGFMVGYDERAARKREREGSSTCGAKVRWETDQRDACDES